MKLRKDITQLIMRLEKPIVGLLQAHNLITRKSKNLAIAELTPEAKVLIGQDEELITDKWLQKWRNLWPPYQKGDLEVIRKKINRFIQEEDADLDMIWRATEKHIASVTEPKYAGNANNFFYKQNPDGTVVSRCKQYLYEAAQEPELPFGGEMLDDLDDF